MSLSSNFPTIKPSLNLDFANTKRLDPRVTFTRSTTGTYYDGVTTAMAEQNLFTYSQDFSNADWTVDGATKTSTNNTDPAGGSTALLLTKTAANGYSLRQYAFAGGSPANLTATISFYLKGTAGDTVVLYLDNGVNQGFASTVTLTASWDRYTLTSTFNSTTANLTGGVSFRSPSTATSVYVAFAQVEYRATATAYTATTTQAITNYIPVLLTAAANVPRFDHNPTTDESLGLLIEAERTNLFTYSSDFSNAVWGKSQSSIVSNTNVAPDGTVTADEFVENTANDLHRLTTPSFAAGTYTLSVYAKADTRTKFEIVTQPIDVGFDLSAGTVLYGTGGTITPVGNGWYRCSVTFTQAITSTMGYGLLNASGQRTYTGDGYSGIFIWGAQLEAASSPTSYIATTSLAVTRTADAASMTGTNFNSWFNNGEGSLFVEGSWITSSATAPNSYYFAGLSDGTGNNAIWIYNTGGNLGAYMIAAGNGQFFYNFGSVITANSVSKIVSAYKTNDSNAVLNGNAGATDTSCVLPTLDRLTIGSSIGATTQMFGHIRRLAYYPVRLTNAQLQAITS